MEDLYPFAVGGTLPLGAEHAGVYPSPVSALGFDANEELLYAGTEDGRLTVTHAPSLERYAAAWAHPHDYAVLTVTPVENGYGGALTVSAARASYHSSGCVKRWSVDDGEADPENDPLTCGAVDPHQLGGSGRAYVGRVGREMIQVDVGSGRVSLRAELTPASCSSGTSCVVAGAPRGLLACGGFGGELVLRDPRNRLRAEMQLSSPAHAAGVVQVATGGDLVATCGLSLDRAGNPAVDPFVKIVDVRAGCRVLNLLQFPAGPARVMFHPKHTSAVVLASDAGLVQIQDADGRGGSGFVSHHLDLRGQRLASVAACRTGEMMAYGDTAGFVHVWSVNDEPGCNPYSVPTEVPPARPACVARYFEPGRVPGADERDRIEPPPYHLAADPIAPPLSYFDPASTVAVGRAPHIIPSEVMKATRMDRDFVGYAPNPHHRRGAPRGEAYRAAAALQNKRAESREKKEDAKRAAAKRSGGGSVSPLPKLYHRVEVRLSANRARFEEFDFSFYNRTRLLGLVNDLANCYVNPVLQMLHFVPELRSRVLMGHTCEREFCLTCELAFLSHMLAQPPTQGAGSHSSASMTAQPLNFLRTLRQVREAAALGLIEGKDELETRLDQSKPRRIQAFQRFLLEQLHKEEGGGDDRPVKLEPKSSAASVRSGEVENLFALSTRQTHRCAQCSREETRSSRSFQTDLQYPDKRAYVKSKPGPTFASCLARSLRTTTEIRAWCEGHQAYTRMSQTKTPTRLPQVLSVNLGMRDADDLRWWGVDVDAHLKSKEASAPVDAHWLPQYIHVTAGEDEVTVTEAMHDLESLDTTSEGATYELTALTCLARRPAEEDDDDSPGGGVDETGAKKYSGHLLSFLKVMPPYVETRGAFEAAAHVPGMSPGVSPIPSAAAAAARAAAERASAASSADTSAADAAPPATPDAKSQPEEAAPKEANSAEKAAAAEIAAEEAAQAVAEDKRKAAQFAAALAAGEAMYGENSGFQGITPSQLATPGHLSGGHEAPADTDWLLFNDFCINPVSAKEVTRMYGQVKLPCLCAYTRVNRPSPPPLPPSPITAELYRRITLDPNLPSRCPFRPFDFETEGETPKPGTILGIDAEFVALAPPVKEVQPDGEEIVVQPMRLGLARVSVVRGDSGPRRLVPVIDDYIRAVEPVYDYLTRFSGLVPGDLDPATSAHHITKLKHAYLKLRYLVDCGCIFVGHGLKQDFKMINIVVPPAQIVDTVELFHFKRQRKLSLRFLASYLLSIDIQQETHDSIEDARTAVRLYEKYLELVEAGTFQSKLLEIYRFGKQYGFTGEKRPDNVGATAASAGPSEPPATTIDRSMSTATMAEILPPKPAGPPPPPPPPPRPPPPRG